MSNEHEHSHHEGCCSHHHAEDFLKAELARQIDEILKKREKAVLHTHTENCGHCKEDDK